MSRLNVDQIYSRTGTGTPALREMPVFYVYRSGAQSLSSSTSTVVELNTKLYDTENWFDTSTYKFTPQIAGYYQINACVFVTGSGLTRVIPAITGTSFSDSIRTGYIPAYEGGVTDSAAVSGSTIIYFNGTTDYIQLNIFVTGSSALEVEGDILGDTYMSGFLVRPD